MYYIYEIPGVKVGCTRDDQFNRRQKGQLEKGEMIILEEHEDIYIASQREIELQKEKGYPVDKYPYWKIITLASKEDRIQGGKTAGAIAVASGQLLSIGSKKDSSKGGKKGGRKNIESGHIQRLGKLGTGGKASVASPNHSCKQKRTCPHCGMITSPGGLAMHLKVCGK